MATLATTAGDQRIGFADQTEELHADEIPVRGAIPDWLQGSLVRVTPAQMNLERGSASHWFDGLAMLHRFGFSDGTVSYANRFLDTEARRGALATGRHPAGFGTDPCRSLFQRVQSIFRPELTDNANVNLTRLGDEYLAMTETPMPIVFDPETLATLGHDDVSDEGQSTTAHPHLDPEHGELINFHIRYGRKSEYRIVARSDREHRRTLATMPSAEPAYMHSFAITSRFVVLLENPLVVNPLRLATSGRAFIHSFRWKPELGLRVHAFDRDPDPTRPLHRSWTLDPCFVFHTINAFEDGDDLVVDLCAYEDASIIGALELPELRSGTGALPGARPLRLTLPLAGGEAAVRELADIELELPRIDYRSRNGLPYRYVYGSGMGAEHTLFETLVKVDVQDGSTQTWQEPGAWPGEPVFVPRPGRDDRDGEDDGVILAVTLDATTGGSFLLVLDAATFTEIARAEAPHRVPFGFHGQFFSA